MTKIVLKQVTAGRDIVISTASSGATACVADEANDMRETDIIRLTELLLGKNLSLFANAGELVRWLAKYEDLAQLVQEIPGDSSPPASIANAVAGLLYRRGFVDSTLVRRLEREFPKRRRDIRAVFGK